MTRCIHLALFNSTVSAVAQTWHSPGDTEENHKKPVRIACALGELHARKFQKKNKSFTI
jgi:hypothetical protein